MPRIPFRFQKFSFVFISILFACQQEKSEFSTKYLEAHRNYAEELHKGRDNYLKLVGLHPLDSGVNTFGSADTNTAVLTSLNIPSNIGEVEISAQGVIFRAEKEIKVKTVESDSAVTRWDYNFSESMNSPMLKVNHLEWAVIKRSTEFFLRVKDQNAGLAEEFKGYETFPLSANYVVDSKFTPFEELKSEEINNSIGSAIEMSFIGILSFELDGTDQDLWVGEGGFLIVGDQTNGSVSYGGGRYLYVDLPEKSGIVIIDFNKLYNPPCVFSEFTTCPFPPSQNKLKLEIEAGEKYKRL